MSTASESPKARPTGRWFQISLRTLLALVTLAAVGAGTWRWYTEPFRRQRLAMAVFEEVGGGYQATVAGPAWLRRLFGEGRFQNIILVNVADCDDPAAYVDHVAALPAIESLVVGGRAFTDEHLRRLHGLTTLRHLVVDCTKVTDTHGALKIRVKDWTDLQHEMRYHTYVTMTGISQLQQALPHCDVTGVVLMH
jgi:hypothetical protein